VCCALVDDGMLTCPFRSVMNERTQALGDYTSPVAASHKGCSVGGGS